MNKNTTTFIPKSTFAIVSSTTLNADFHCFRPVVKTINNLIYCFNQFKLFS